ncbi:MAG: methyltransferase domain-containing protein [Gammaproteobacteria bacterium]|nr:methyltransferase domain-containing protein [Gammaproteobacteria bacterium]
MGEFEEFGAAERAGWTDRDVAARYIAQFTDAADQAMAGMVAAVSPESGQAVLDLCCGHGAMTSALCDRGCNVTGLDFSSAMLAHAEQRAPNARFREGDAQDLPFDDASFDVVLSNCGIMHLPDQPRALSEVRRVLRTNGTFAMTVWCGPDISPSFRIAFGAMKAHADPSVSAPPQPDFFQFARRDGAEEMLRGAGLQAVTHDTIDCVWHLDTPEQLFKIYSEATVRMAMILSAQPASAVEAIRQAMTEAVARDHAVDGGYRVQIPAALVIARA